MKKIKDKTIYYNGAGPRYHLAVKYAQGYPDELAEIESLKPLMDMVYMCRGIMSGNVGKTKKSALEHLRILIPIYRNHTGISDFDALLQFLKITEYGKEDFWEAVKKN